MQTSLSLPYTVHFTGPFTYTGGSAGRHVLYTSAGRTVVLGEFEGRILAALAHQSHLGTAVVDALSQTALTDKAAFESHAADAGLSVPEYTRTLVDGFVRDMHAAGLLYLTRIALVGYEARYPQSTVPVQAFDFAGESEDGNVLRAEDGTEVVLDELQSRILNALLVNGLHLGKAVQSVVDGVLADEDEAPVLQAHADEQGVPVADIIDLIVQDFIQRSAPILRFV